MTRPQRVTVTIDRLVLGGFASTERDAIAAGLAGALRAQFADAEAVRALGGSRSLAALRAAPVALASAATPQQAGAQAGRALARSVRS
jgi:hypothetical protein